MSSTLSSHSISVNINTPGRNTVQYRQMKHVQRQTQPELKTDDTKIIQVARPVNESTTIVRTNNIVEIHPISQTVKTQTMQSISAPSNTFSTQFESGSRIDIYV